MTVEKAYEIIGGMNFVDVSELYTDSNEHDAKSWWFFQYIMETNTEIYVHLYEHGNGKGITAERINYSLDGDDYVIVSPATLNPIIEKAFRTILEDRIKN